MDDNFLSEDYGCNNINLSIVILWCKFVWTTGDNTINIVVYINITKKICFKNHNVLIYILRVRRAIAARLRSRRGKSELRRAGCWITSSQGDLKESATEIYRLSLLR